MNDDTSVSKPGNEVDPAIERDRQALQEAAEQGGVAKLAAYARLSGPGWLQSALTLGGGSLASSLYLGVLAGVSMMWVQPLAMILGIIMLSAISYVTLSTGERPFRSINDHVNPVLGWAWLLASLAANMIWALPQYSLCYGVLEQNLLPGVLGSEAPLAGPRGQWTVSLAILAISTVVVWSYGSGGWGIKLFEVMLKCVVALIVLCFFGVVARLATQDGVPWGDVLRGFIPNFRQLYEPAEPFRPLLAAIGDEQARAFWHDYLISQQRHVMFSAAATAVGINMTFLLPYSMLARGWDKHFRGLAIFDLSTGMLIPFVLATSCVVIASANQFHAQVPENFDTQHTGYQELLKRRRERLPTAEAEIDEGERRLAAMLVHRDARDLAKALEPLTGSTVANVVFGIGVVGMTLSTISLLMLVSGFAICEILNVPAKGWPLRVGCMCAASGVLWPLLWGDESSRTWLAVVASVFGGALLPIAYCTFFLLMNQRSLLGSEMPSGARRLRWNVLMGVAATVASLTSIYFIWQKSKGIGSPWYGMGAVIALVAAILVAQVTKPKK